MLGALNREIAENRKYPRNAKNIFRLKMLVSKLFGFMYICTATDINNTKDTRDQTKNRGAGIEIAVL